MPDKLIEISQDRNRMQSLERRFWKYVERGNPGECWIWKGCATPLGYGRMSSGRNAFLKATRVSWLIHSKKAPGDLSVLHKCDNPRCVNPEHLFLGTNLDNIADMIAKGRGSKPPTRVGDAHHNVKFSSETALKIKNDTRSASAIAAEYEISTRTVYRIRKGLTWKHLPMSDPSIREIQSLKHKRSLS